MTAYSNLNGDSGVVEYEIGVGSIVVTFNDGSAYLYDSERPGAQHVRQMMHYALAGRGLNAYIGRHVRKRYSQKLR